MLTIKDFTTNHENLVNLLSVATYGNYWPSVATYKSDAKAGLFDDCDCREDKWAKALMHGKGCTQRTGRFPCEMFCVEFAHIDVRDDIDVVNQDGLILVE